MPQFDQYIGADLSLTNSVLWVIRYKGGKLAMEQHRVTSTPKMFDSWMERLEAVSEKLLETIDEKIKEFPKTLYVQEDYIYSLNSQVTSLIQLAEMGGLVKLGVYKRKIESHIVSPTVLKQFVTNTGKAKKEMMILECFKRFGVTCADNNEADALGLAKMAEALDGRNTGFTKYQKGLLEKKRPIYAKIFV